MLYGTSNWWPKHVLSSERLIWHFVQVLKHLVSYKVVSCNVWNSSWFKFSFCDDNRPEIGDLWNQPEIRNTLGKLPENGIYVNFFYFCNKYYLNPDVSKIANGEICLFWVNLLEVGRCRVIEIWKYFLPGSLLLHHVPIANFNLVGFMWNCLISLELNISLEMYINQFSQ